MVSRSSSEKVRSLSNTGSHDRSALFVCVSLSSHPLASNPSLLESLPLKMGCTPPIGEVPGWCCHPLKTIRPPVIPGRFRSWVVMQIPHVV
jgi:hypothetical protein